MTACNSHTIKENVSTHADTHVGGIGGAEGTHRDLVLARRHRLREASELPHRAPRSAFRTRDLRDGTSSIIAGPFIPIVTELAPVTSHLRVWMRVFEVQEKQRIYPPSYPQPPTITPATNAI